MKILARSFQLRCGSVARAACAAALALGACAGSGSGGSATGGAGGTSPAASGGSSSGGKGTGGGSGATGAAGASTVGTGGSGSGSGGAAGAGPGAGGSVPSGVAGSSGGSQAGAGGSGQAGAGGGAGSGSGPSHCGPRAGLLFCDDFEQDTPGAPPAPWTTSIIGAGTVTIDGSDPAASGTKSVHIQDGDSDYDTLLALHDTSVLPSTTGRFYLRFYIRLAAPMTAGHNSFVRGDLFASPGNADSLLFSEDNQMLAESIGGDAQGAMSNNNFYTDGKIGPALTAGQWACVELLLDHVTPEIDVWLNGTEIPDLKSTAWAIDAYDYLRFGFEKYAGPGSEIWYDDIAIGTQPIGCN